MTQRTAAKVAGCTYLGYIVFSMSSSILYARATAGDDASQTLSTLARMISTARVTVAGDASVGTLPIIANSSVPPRTRAASAKFSMVLVCTNSRNAAWLEAFIDASDPTGKAALLSAAFRVSSAVAAGWVSSATSNAEDGDG